MRNIMPINPRNLRDNRTYSQAVQGVKNETKQI